MKPSQRNEADGSPIDLLEGLEGLDTAKGLFHVSGNKDAYLDILRSFCKEFDGHEAAVEQFLAAGDWKGYSIKFHSLKGLFAAIGMNELSQKAAGLETASKNGDTVTCRETNASVIQAMRSFRDSLYKTPLMDIPEAGPKTPIDPDALAGKLAELKKACLKGDCGVADRIAAELKIVTIDEKYDSIIDKICSFTDSLDYEEAAQLIDGLNTEALFV